MIGEKLKTKKNNKGKKKKKYVLLSRNEINRNWLTVFTKIVKERREKFCKMNVTAGKNKKEALQKKMQALQIYEEDIEEKFIRSQGKGGQKVNKTSNCVYIKHIPTGIEVKCQQERSQDLNRFFARRLLASKIETIKLGKLSEERKRIEKIKRQKRKRSKRAKEKVLKNKSKQSEKKLNRAYKPKNEDLIV